MLFLVVELGMVVAPLATANGATTNLTYNLGFRQAATDTLMPAVEFSLRYELQRTSTDPRWHHFNWALFTQGYQTFNSHITDVDHMEVGLAMAGRYYRTALTPLAPELQDYYTDLLERSEAGGGPGITEAQEAELGGLVARVRGHRAHIGYTAYSRFVTDQQVDNRLLNFGLGAQAEVPWLGGWLDTPFRVTRSTGPFVSQPLRASLSAEYVQGMGNREDAYPRAFLECLWSTRAFDRMYPRIRWQAEYSTENPVSITSFNHFLDAGIALPVSPGTSVVFKYLYGRTAPNYELVNAAVLGFDVVGW
jgi:hypothetical protein